MLSACNLRSRRENPAHIPHLIYHNFNITQVLDSILGVNESLQFLYLLSGIKPGARTQIEEQAYGFVQELCSALGLFVLKSDFYVGSASCRGAQYTYKKIFAPKRKNKIFIYLAPDKNRCSQLKNAESKGDDYEFGKLLGYPACCIKNFAKGVYQRPGDFSMNSIGLPTFAPYPFLNNPALWLFGIRLLCHYPCQPGCKKSLKLAQQYARILKKISPNYYNFLKRELSSLVICSRDGGLVYSTNYSKTRHGITIYEIKGDPRDPLYNLIKKHGVLTLGGPDRFHVGNKLLSWPETKVIKYY